MTTAPPTVSTAWLAENLDSPTPPVLLDATVFLEVINEETKFVSGINQYVDAHIPGARFADLFEKFSDPGNPLPFTRPDTAQFEAAASEIGVDNNTRVVVYDALAGQWAARLWWLFRSFGHDQVSVLDGGLQKWVREDRPTTDRFDGYTRAQFTAESRDELVSDHTAVEAAITNGTYSLACSLEQEDFAGRVKVRARVGHIPTSINIAPSSLINREDNTLKDNALLLQLFADSQLELQGPIIVYCGGGIGSALLSLALYRVGISGVSLYDGSLLEWVSIDRLPLVTGD